MHDALGNTLVIEVRYLFAQDEVFEQCRAAHARLQRILIVRDRYTLVRRQHTTGGVGTHAVNVPLPGFRPMRGSPAPSLSEASVSVSVLPVTLVVAGSAVMPAGGIVAALPCSLALFALNGHARTS